MLSYRVQYFSYMYLGICILEFSAVYLGMFSKVSSSYSLTYIELFQNFYQNYSVNNGIFKQLWNCCCILIYI
jgi:hypothetical protein